jgi:hypothetical protein
MISRNGSGTSPAESLTPSFGSADSISRSSRGLRASSLSESSLLIVARVLRALVFFLSYGPTSLPFFSGFLFSHHAAIMA